MAARESLPTATIVLQTGETITVENVRRVDFYPVYVYFSTAGLGDTAELTRHSGKNNGARRDEVVRIELRQTE